MRLGRWLFFDRRLSVDNTVSCATCHEPQNAFSQLTAHATGILNQPGKRKSPTFVNCAWPVSPVFFWDGRAKSLEDQALGPIENPVEMGNTHTAMIASLEKIQGYRPFFKQAFGTPEITKERVARAVADYERTRMSGNSPWDRWQAGDTAAVDARVRIGHWVFHARAACARCRPGENFSDSQFHNIGVGWDSTRAAFADSGRVLIPRPNDTGAFKTPTLREVARHPPYMHDGSQATLREVVEFYNRGGHPNPHLSDKVGPLNLTDEQQDALAAFMEALNGEGYADSMPALFRSRPWVRRFRSRRTSGYTDRDGAPGAEATRRPGSAREARRWRIPSAAADCPDDPGRPCVGRLRGGRVARAPLRPGVRYPGGRSGGAGCTARRAV